MDFKEIRQKYPDYNDMSDEQFAQAFHRKYYSDISFDDFAKKTGYWAVKQEKQSSSPVSDLWEGAKGTAAFAGDALSAMVKIPAQAALAVGGKIGDPSRSLQDTWETAGAAMEETFPSFAKPLGVDPEKNLAYKAAMYPFQKYGEGIEWAAEKGSFGNKDLQGSINIAGNLLPIPLAKKGGKLAGSIMTRLDPMLYNIEVDAANAKNAKRSGNNIADIVASEKTPDVPVGDVDFWKQRAAQMTEEARKKELPPPVIRAEQKDPFNPYPTAGTPEQMEGLRRSQENIEYNQIPPDAVVPETSFKAGIEVPPEQMWTVDENGIPVRQGLPDPLSAPDYVNKYMLQNEAARNELGNAIQEANGPRLGQQDTFGTEPLSGPHGAPDPFVNPYTGRGAAARGALFPNRRPQDKHTLPGADMLKLAVKLLPAKVSPSSEKIMAVANIVGLKDTPYSRVNTVQQVMENPGPDLSPLLRSTKDYMQSGLEGTLRHNPKNQAINFARNKMQEARNFAERLSKQYLTSDKTGLNAQLNKLSTKEKTDVVGLMLELDRQEVPLSDRIMEKAGFTENQKAVARAMREADDVLYAERNRVLGELGYDATPYREGHMPGNFGGAYRTLIGYTDKDGNFHITGIAQADTKLGHTKALEYYRNLPEDPGKKRVEVPLGRTGPGQRIRSSPYDAWADLVQEVSKHDPKFAETLRIAEQKTKDTIASMYNFHVHEKAKKGIVGSYGNRPWLSAEQNAKEFLKGFIDYLEEGYRYTSYQQPLNEIAQLTMNPEFRASHPNTVKYLERYVRHVTGSNLNPIGAAGNWAIDQALKAVGLGNNQFNKVSRELTQASTLHMMGVFNPGFFLAQLTQWATGGIPEAAQIRATLKQDPQLMVNSLQRAILDITALNIEENTGKVVRDVPQHMKDAYKWGHDNGLFTFSEVALAHEVLQSKLRRKVTPYLDWPIRLGEQATRPTVFLTFADMFHNAGFRGEEVMLRAQAATDWAMVNYHPDERPMIYQSLGALGNSLGALSTYKHNLVSQYGQRAMQAGKYPMAAAAMLGMGYALYGVSGLPGYQEATDMAERITDKPLREMILSDPKQSSTFMDGVLSAKTGVDFQSRLSMSNVLPDSPMSAFPHISNFVNIMDKAYEAGMNWDQGSATEFAKALAPAGIKPIVEHMTAPKDKEGNVYPTTKEGMNKYSTPRSTKEQVVRDILGVRPLRERLEDERIWSTRKSEAKRQDKLKDALMRFDRAYLNGDTDGMAKAEDDYTKNDGDITTLYNSSRLRSVTEKSVQDEATRRAGKPTKNLNTLKRYEEFTQ